MFLRDDVRGILVYGTAAPILSVWALVSFFPLAGAGMAWGSPLLVIAHLAFLLIGFFGFIGSYLFYRWARLPVYTTDYFVTVADKRKRTGFLTLYALLWMIAYAVFVSITT